VAVVPKAAEKRLDELGVAEEVVPFGILEVGRDNRWPSPIAFVHQLEERVRLLGLEIQIPHLIDLC